MNYRNAKVDMNLTFGEGVAYSRVFYDRSGSSQGIAPPAVLGPTPFQLSCAREYSHLSEDIRPKPSDFLAVDPVVTRAAWKTGTPRELVVDVTQDSALDVMRKLQMRANGGMIIIDSHAAPSTDMLVRSEHDNLATPGIPGATATVEVPDKRKSDDVIEGMELHTSIAPVINHGLPKGSRVYAATLNKLGLGQRPSLGEKTARVFAPETSVPHFMTATGKRLESFMRLSMRSVMPTDHHAMIARELMSISGIEFPKDLCKVLNEFAGDRLVRSSALGDRQYHAITVHASQAGSVKVCLAPLVSDSFGPGKTLSWQTLRTCVRATGYLNFALDQGAREIGWQEPQYYLIGYDVAQNAVSEFKIVTGSLSVMGVMQAKEAYLPEGPLGKAAQKRLLAASAFASGGIRDMAEFERELADGAATALLMDGEDDLAYRHYKASFAQSRVSVQTPLLSPVVDMRNSRGEVVFLTETTSVKISNIPIDNLRACRLETTSSIVALMRFGVSVGYMNGMGDIKMQAAILVKQWKLVEDAGKQPLWNNPVTVCCAAVFNDEIFRIMRKLIPFCSFQTIDAFVRTVTMGSGLQISSAIQDKDELFKHVFLTYLASSRGSHLRKSLRSFCGKLIHAGMADTGLMFALRTRLKKDHNIVTIVVDFMKYKIGVWVANYQAQLQLVSRELADTRVENDVYKKVVLWQQKIKSLGLIEIIPDTVRDIVVVVATRKAVNVLLLHAYTARYDRIKNRLMHRQGRIEVLWDRKDHPWGERETQAELDELAEETIDHVLDFLRTKDERYWVITPDEMFKELDEMMHLVFSGIQRVVDDTCGRPEEEGFDSGVYQDVALPPAEEAAVTAKFQFSIADPPTVVERNLERIARATGKTTVPAPPVEVSSGRVGFSGFSGFGMTRRAIMSPPKVVEPDVTLRDILEAFSEEERPSVLLFLKYLAGGDVTADNTVAVLPRKYQGKQKDKEAIIGKVLIDYDAYMYQATIGSGRTYDDSEDVVDQRELY